jgi:hypothetical protein
MKTATKFLSKGLIVYTILIGTVFCLLCANDFFLSVIEKAVETRFNPFRIMAWLAIFLGR